MCKQGCVLQQPLAILCLTKREPNTLRSTTGSLTEEPLQQVSQVGMLLPGRSVKGAKEPPTQESRLGEALDTRYVDPTCWTPPFPQTSNCLAGTAYLDIRLLKPTSQSC